MKRLLIPLVIFGLLASFFIWVYGPARARKIAQKYDNFRSAFQSVHDEIDALYNHQDRLVNGIKWHYVDEGASDGEVILFLHGLPECWYSWHDIMPLIDKNYRQIVIDMKGYGRSDLVDEDYDWHTVAGQIVALMDSIGIKKFYVVSHDWGSLIGSVMVYDYQDRILGFIRMEADLLPKKGFERRYRLVFRLIRNMKDRKGYFTIPVKGTLENPRMTVQPGVRGRKEGLHGLDQLKRGNLNLHIYV